MPARSIHTWFDEYGESHLNETNVLIHWFCVPTIYFCVVALLWSIPVPSFMSGSTTGLVAKVVTVLVGLFYLRLSFPIMLGMMIFSIFCLWLCRWIDALGFWPLWVIALGLFVAAWIGQFYGHKVEGKKPSFLKDLQFLMIGPAWLMSKIYHRLGIAY